MLRPRAKHRAFRLGGKTPKGNARLWCVHSDQETHTKKKVRDRLFSEEEGGAIKPVLNHQLVRDQFVIVLR